MRVGIVGVGGMGNTHANKYRQMRDVELSAYDVDPERLATFCVKTGAEARGSLDHLIDCCDIVDICLPTHLHMATAGQAIHAGRATFVEKPMAGNVVDCRTMIQAAEREGVLLMPGQVVRFFPEFATGRRLVHSGSIGTPAAARTRRGGKAPVGAGGWFKDAAKSGGILLDLAVHDFDWLRWTLGEVRHVFARTVQIRPEWLLEHQPPEVGDYALTTLTFDSGCVAHVETTWLDPGGSRATFEVCGSGGMIEFDSRQSATVRTTTGDGSRLEAPLAPDDDPYYLQLRSFVDAVKNRTQPPVSAWDGLAAVAIAEAAIESAKTGMVVPVVT
ncbi:MAG: Gfo/Idh/MocA family oxidoreductase [Fimbriimonadaceae bacterium]|nr:Gfo/Idh/MocA family oxidoreductase [Fimbriimonadaceae bacterium]